MTLALGSLAVVLLFAMVRPRGWPEAVVAVPAAALLIATGVVTWEAARAEIVELLPVVGFLAAVLVLAKLCDDEGLFHAAGIAMARRSRGNPRTLLIAVFVIAAGTTAVLSLDATVVLLTPVVLATARTLQAPARPHAYATAHLANTASLLLPVSNLTNLLAFGAAGISFLHFTSLMAAPWILAIAAEFVLLRLLFRRELAVRPATTEVPPPAEIPVFVLIVLALTLVGFVVASGVGVAPAWAALAGVVVLGWHGLARSRTSIAGIVHAANLPFLAFVLCLGVVVTGVTDNGLGDAMRGMLPSGTGFVALLGIAVIAALLANVVNNLPAVLVLLPLVSGAGPAAVLAVLIGVNVGPNLTYPGSLSNLLWRNVIRRERLDSGFVEFSRIGLLTTPVTLVVAVCGLWLAIQVVGT
ncbi:SLC13 family permease [Mycolicibacterium arenosum]|uniref:SLC13 family permease n=1 Tax=Mycolicibacterium arenosum TaxID=2952157 RepID=A0ABT1M8V9_9MYCO|nr:SLC13 family permease [Mycolicibacterium sp. CAU 1645]MCP9275563.1 SLC13 family permease [Mycolicibacterium sp. CAU 1645]